MNQKRIGIILLAIVVLVFSLGFWYVGQGNTPPPTPPPEDGMSFSMYQALYLQYVDGSDTWKYPSSRTEVPLLTIKDLDSGKAVSSMQVYVYFNIQSNKQIISVAFNAESEVTAWDLTPTFVADLGGGWVPISHVVANPEVNVDTYVISATITAEQFENLLLPYLPYDFGGTAEGYYVISIRDINAYVSYLDGTTEVYSLTGVQSQENQLWWKFQFDTTSGVLSVVEVRWDWV